MAKNVCIAVGINRYQFFQPLSYAEADAQGLQTFLVEEAGVASDRCFLLTDTAFSVSDRSSYPTRDNIIAGWEFCQANLLQAGDTLWFFFSGYGVSTGGEDYLMPIDGNPDDIANTGISVRSLLQELKQQNDVNVLVLLDMNRSQAIQSGAIVGQITAELSRQLEIATILSCQPDQFSHEAAALAHGLFTAALLEALRYDPSMTLASLEQYLRDRLSELSEHHWQPLQTPLVVIPSTQAHRPLIVPTKVRQPERSLIPYALLAGGKANSSAIASHKLMLEPVVASVGIASTALTTNAEAKSEPVVLFAPSTEKMTDNSNTTPWWLQLLFWGAGTAIVVGTILAVFLKVFNPQQALQTPIRQETASPAPQASAPRLQANLAVLEKARSMIQPNQASDFSRAIQEARKIQPGEPLYGDAQAAIDRWSEVILDLAEARANQGNFQAAMAAARLIPQDRAAFAKSQQAMARWKEKAAQQRANRIILEAARGLIRETEASSYNRAITAAGKILPNQLGAADAKKAIAEWSRRIYLIAQSRAARGDLKNAIETAKLVPENTPSHQAARAAISKWQQKLVTKN